MDTRDIKTSLDLADALENIATVLRAVPEFQITEHPQVSETLHAKKMPQKKAHHRISDVEDLAKRLPDLSRDGAETEMKALTVPSIRLLASLLEIRIPSKMTKNETIDMLLSHVYDIPAGQELIRTFHKRNAAS